MGRIDDLVKGAVRLGRSVRRAVARESARIRSRLAPRGVRFVFDPRYRVPDNELADPARPQKVLDHLDMRGWLGKELVSAPPPLTMRQLLRVHERGYLEALDDPRVLRAVFGDMSLRHDHAAALLRSQRWATSGTVHAARLAMGLSTRRGTPIRFESRKRRNASGGRIVNLGGGLHHAHPGRGAGFCAFNDIAVAIGELRNEGFEGRVLVIDLDLHHGDGTRAFFARDPLVHTYSLHAATWDSSPAVAALDVELGPAVGNETYLRALRSTLPDFFSEAAPQLVFFVAGVDVAHDDRLGAYRLTEDAIFARDRYVFELSGGLPTVMVLAGGYGPDAWRYSARTLLWLLSGEDHPIPTRDELALMHFRRIRRGIAQTTLSTKNDDAVDTDESWSLTDDDLTGGLFGREREPRLLGFYSDYGLELALERYGLADQIRARGYPDFEVAMDSTPTSGQGMRIYADASRREILLELVVSEFYGVSPFKLLCIEWLMLQDPRRKPTPGEHLLPGQKHPGLGALNTVVGMLIMACERLGFDGLTFVPAHFHLAARARRLLKVLDPIDEALFLALASATGPLGIFEASRGIEKGEVVDVRTGEPVVYTPMRMVLPVSAALKEKLESASYAEGVEEAARNLHLELVPSSDAVAPSSPGTPIVPS